MANKLKPEIKKKWVAALRSGEYKQARRLLHGGGGYCCLGVLCEVMAKDTGLDFGEFADENEEMPNHELIDTVFDCETLESHTWAVTPPGEGKVPTSLAMLNDSDGFTFDQIADLIEEQM